jgi:hypothetical protein
VGQAPGQPRSGPRRAQAHHPGPRGSSAALEFLQIASPNELLAEEPAPLAARAALLHAALEPLRGEVQERPPSNPARRASERRNTLHPLHLCRTECSAGPRREVGRRRKSPLRVRLPRLDR